MIECPKSIIFEFKKLIGCKFKDKVVEDYKNRWPMKIIEDKNIGKPKFIIKIWDKRIFPWRYL